MASIPPDEVIDLQRHSGCRLWIDGVGCWLLWFRQELDFGSGIPLESGPFRYRIRADLLPVHWTWQRRERANWGIATGSTTLNHVRLHSDSILKHDDEIDLGDEVSLQFRIASPLSGSGSITVKSGHRNVDYLDGVVLFDQTCLLGESDQSHIPCSTWGKAIVMFEREGQLWWRYSLPGSKLSPAHHNEIIVSKAGRLRFEALV